MKMVSPISRLAQLKALPTYEILPFHHRQVWLDHLVGLEVSHERPEDDEEFKGPRNCLERLNAWGFVEGCAYVTTRSRPKNASPNWPFQCIFHDEALQNKWKLPEDRVEREKGEIISQRKRDTNNLRRGCEVQYFLSYKSVKRGLSDKIYTGRWRATEHSGHQLPVNPLAFHRQLKSTVSWQQASSQARKYRVASQPFHEAVKLLKTMLLVFNEQAILQLGTSEAVRTDRFNIDSSLTESPSRRGLSVSDFY